MSSFMIKAKHKASGEIHDISCIDDYFGRRRYGYIGRKCGYMASVPNVLVMTEEEFYDNYDLIKDTPHE